MILTDYKQYILCKDIFLRFCKQFTSKAETDIQWLTSQKSLLEKEPELTSYIYQFALEASYARKRFNDKEIEAVFDAKFIIKDIYQTNGGLSDISTLNSAFIVNHMVNHTPFKDISFTLLSTPFEYHTPRYYYIQNTPKVREFVKQSQQITGNSNADVLLNNNKIYDIKHSNVNTTSKNHIQPWTYEQVETQMPNHMRNLLAELKTKYPENSFIIKTLENIKNEKTLTWSQKNNIWNQVIAENLDKISPNCPLPIIVEMTTKPFIPMMPKSVHEKIHIKAAAITDYNEARRAISGITNYYGQKYVKNAYEMTNGVIIPLESIHEVD